MIGLARIVVIALLVPGTIASAETSPVSACEYFARGNFEPNNNFGHEAQRYYKQGDYKFGPAALIDTSLERYQTWFWSDVSVAIFKKVTDTTPITFLSTTMTCSIDIKDRRVLEVAIQPGPRIGERVNLSDGDYQFMIEPKSVHVVIGENVHKGKF